MTKKDYKIIAQILVDFNNITPPKFGYSSHSALLDLVCNTLEKNYPNFDRIKFGLMIVDKILK